MKAQTQRSLRNLHNWFGMFFAPGILFFSFTGVLQTLGLHEADDGVRPPAWIAAIANLHKHQVVSHGRKAPFPTQPGLGDKGTHAQTLALPNDSNVFGQAHANQRSASAKPPRFLASYANVPVPEYQGSAPRAPRPADVALGSPREAGHDDHDHDHDHDHDAPLSPLKLYVVLLSAVLFATTLAGVVIALTNRAARRRTGALLAAGTAVPVLLLLV